MANSKQKTVPEGGQRKPGKTKFSIPRKEAPPVDGSYLERLFADYNRQSKEIEEQDIESQPIPEVPEQQQFSEEPQLSPIHTATPLREAAAEPSAEVLDVQEFATPVPFPPQEITHSETEKPAPLTPSALPDATRVSDAKPSGVTDIDPLPSVQQGQPFEDQSLIEGWKKRHRLSKGEVKVLQVLVRMCREGDDHHCYIKVPQLMVDADLKERQTQLVLRNLRELGLIEKVAEYSNADRAGTQYRIAFEAE